MALGALTASQVSCLSRTGYDFSLSDDPAPTNWGDFAATLDVPDCPSSNPVLTVNTTADELDGGQSITDPSQAGDYLSFAEAIWIATNRDTPHNIFFDGEVFPASTPGVIHIRDYYEMPVNASGLCIDGRRRGVVIEHDSGIDTATACPGGAVGCSVPLDDGGALVGLTFKKPLATIWPSPGARIAGCYVDSVRGVELRPSGFLLGPGNVFTLSSGFAVVVWAGGTDGEIVGNYFGYDPVARAMLPCSGPVTSFTALTVRSNVFGACLGPTLTTASAGVVFAVGNYFGVDDHLDPLPGAGTGLSISGSLAGLTHVGPGNIIRGVEGAAVVHLLGSSTMTVTRNLISGNGGGIVYGAGSPVAPPAITAVSRSTVSGTCAAAGTIEVFSDPGDQGEQFLGDVACDGVNPWTLGGTIPHGRNATATLTDANGATSPFSAPFAVP